MKQRKVDRSKAAFQVSQISSEDPEPIVVVARSVMLARKVSMYLKSDCAGAFIQKIENELIPLLRKQKGFLDEMTLIAPSGKEAHSYSFWEGTEDAENYGLTAFSDATKLLAHLIDGKPRVQTYVVANSTFYKMAAALA